MINSPGTIPPIVWPDIPVAPDADLLGLLFQLEQTQWWPAERLREAQLLRIRLLARHAFSRVPFHRGLPVLERGIRVGDRSRRALNAMRLVMLLVVRLSSVT